MKMIPNFVDRFPSYAEEKIFQLIKGSNIDGFTLHSLNIQNHSSKQIGEADFVLVTDFGLIVLEIKGGVLDVTSGVWSSFRPSDTDKRNPRKIESPFTQAYDNVFSLLDGLKSSLDFFIPIAWGVITPDCSLKSIETPEWESWQNADYIDCGSTKRFDRWLRELVANKVKTYEGSSARGRVRESNLSANEKKRIMQKLRPNFESTIPLGKRIVAIGERRKKFTEEQFEKLDEIGRNDRVLVRGGAGTGKTFLAVEVLRRVLAKGKSVKLISRNQYLVDFLREQYPDFSCHIYHADQLSGLQGRSKQEVLIVDEGQDLLTSSMIDLLDGVLAGGFENGSWYWFMDDQHQAGFYRDTNPEWVELLEKESVQLDLIRNCRNTKPVIEYSQAVTGAYIGKAVLEGAGKFPERKYYEKSNLSEMIDSGIQRFLSDDISKDQIVVLHSGNERIPLAGKFSNIKSLTVCEFKGLESHCVILVCSDVFGNLEDQMNEIYTGITRACVQLLVLIPIEYQREWDQILVSNIEKM